MYFSRISLLPNAERSDEFWKVATGPYQIHSMIWDLFSDSEKRDRDFLYRMDMVRGKPLIFVVSDREPVYMGGVWNVDTKKYDPMISEGQRFGFSLRANPIVTKTIPASPGVEKKRYRHDVVMDAKTRYIQEHGKDASRPPIADIVQQEGFRWLSSRADRCGFQVDGEQVRADSYQQLQFHQGNKNRQVSLSTIDFTGILTVTDEEQFVNTLGKGIGPAKGFGCGLMMIRRV